MSPFWRRARNLFRKRDVEQELDDEIRAFVELVTDERVAAGMDPVDARRQALLQLGGVEQVKEKVRAVRLGYVLESVLQDVRYGWRALSRAPVLTGVAVCSMALGTAVSAAMFGVVHRVLLQPLPYGEPDRLVRPTGFYPKGALAGLQSLSRTLEVAGFTTDSEFNLTGDGEPLRVRGGTVSANVFDVLLVEPRLGRAFEPDDERPERNGVTIISHQLWRDRFRSDPRIVGRTVVLDGVGRTIVGVMPADFSFPSESSQLWIPLTDDPANIEAHWGTGFMPLVARLRPWATVEQAQDELTALVSRITAMFPYEMARTWNADATVIPLQQDIVRDVRDRIRVLAWAVAFVLLIVCANVGSLLLSRTTTRQPELCVRSALGAGRARLVRQLLTEGLMIAVIGAAAGLVLAVAALSFLKAAFPPETPRLSGARIDVWVVAFTSGLALISGAWLAVVASIQAWTPRGEILRNRRPHAGRGAVRLRNLLITGQVALTVTLTVGAGLLLKSLTLLAQVDPGFRPEHVQIVRVFPDQSTCGTRAACLSFYDELLRRTRAITGVSTVAATNALPLTGESSGVPVEVEDHPLRPREQLAPIVSARAITPEYFRIMRVPVLAGRSFTEADRDGTPGVVLVSAATARRFWPEEPAVGKRLRPVWDEQWRTVIGVVGDVRLPDIEGAAGGFSGVVYMPYPQAVGNNRQLPIALGVVVRTTLDPGELGREFRAVVAGLSEQVPVGEVTTMTSVVSRATLPSRSIAWVFAWFAGAALVLAAVGVYGSVAYSAGQRVFELGVRAALGATRPRLVALVLSQSFASVLAGLVLGVMAALVMSRALAGFLFGVTATDPDTFMQVGLLVVVVALFAAFLPARAASRVDPAKALRAE